VHASCIEMGAMLEDQNKKKHRKKSGIPVSAAAERPCAAHVCACVQLHIFRVYSSKGVGLHRIQGLGYT